MPVCYCGEKVVLRTARTPKNRGKQFWGCPKYKVRSMELWFFSFKLSRRSLTSLCMVFGQRGSEQLVGCNYFSWFNGDENEEIIGSVTKNEERDVSVLNMEEMYGQRMKILILEKSVMNLENMIRVLFWGVCFVCVLNVILFSLLMKNP